MTRIDWNDLGTGVFGCTDIDVDAARNTTSDIDGDLGASVAGWIAKSSIDLSEYAAGSGPVVEITEPEDLRGVYAISVSRTVRDNAAPKNKQVRLLTDVQAERDIDPSEIFVGVRAERRTPQENKDIDGLRIASARLTRPEDTKHLFTLLGNVYGHDIENGANAEENEHVGRLEKLYLNGTLHDCGWPARSTVTGEIGFLAVTEVPETGWSDEVAERFLADNHLPLHFAPGFAGPDDRDVVLCFVPMSRIDSAKDIIGALEDLTAPIAPTR